MTPARFLIHTTALLLLPLIVAFYDLSLFSAILLVLLLLLWRWALSLSLVKKPPNLPDLQLETISASHYVEKVRWCLDRLGVEYEEKSLAGILGVLFLGRTVPALHFKAGLGRSRIGNSDEILRYLYGRYTVELGEKADFLAPTKQRLQFERELDRYGRCLQVWVYYHILDDRDITLRAWGTSNPYLPEWQRWTLITLFPLLQFFLRNLFQLSDAHYAKVKSDIGQLLSGIEEELADDRRSLLGGDEINYTDISFAALSGLWVRPDHYGGGNLGFYPIDQEGLPELMQSDVNDWCEKYPKTYAFIERMYAEERIT